MLLFYNEQTTVLHAAYSKEQLALGTIMTRKEVYAGEPVCRCCLPRSDSD